MVRGSEGEGGRQMVREEPVTVRDGWEGGKEGGRKEGKEGKRGRNGDNWE